MHVCVESQRCGHAIAYVIKPSDVLLRYRFPSILLTGELYGVQRTYWSVTVFHMTTPVLQTRQSSTERPIVHQGYLPMAKPNLKRESSSLGLG